MKYPQLVSMPSKVSDWLEEQLEARGIDAVVYTRYILSLFHSDTVDVICSDEDLHFSHLKKEVKRSGGNSKRFRRSSEWWRHGEAEADKLRRSAAVECLMSASEQTSGIETLVDELCEKLKEVDNDVHVPNEVPLSKKNLELPRASPQELANRYYAAFPPLTRKSTTSPSSLITLIPKWIPSPKRKNIAASSAVSRKHNNRSYEDKFHCRMDTENLKPRNPGKSRFSYLFGRNKKELGRNVVKSVECMDPFGLCLFTNNVTATTTCPDWPENDENLKVETVKEADHCMSNNEWKMEEELNMYDDIVVDIKELLEDSPTHQDNVDQMNVANMRDTGKRGFVQYGLTSSIWSTGTAINEDYYGQSNKDLEISESMLDLKFKSIYVDLQATKNDQNSINSSVFENDNNKNMVVESIKNSFVTDPWNYQACNGKWSDDSGCFDEENDPYKMALSLIKLNHNKEASPFVEVPQRSKSFAPFTVTSGGNSGINRDASLRMIDLDNDKEDLLTSITSHFRPIKEHVENSVRGEYADGATFSSTTNTVEKVNYRRTESGAMYLESDYAMRKKYVEYKTDSQQQIPFGLVLKFTVSGNDKSCQTDNGDDFFGLVGTSKIGRGIIGEDSNGMMIPCKCTCLSNLNAMNMDYDTGYGCPVHPCRSNNVTLGGGIWSQYELTCESCSAINWSTTFVNKNFQDEPMWNGKNMWDIWKGNEVCCDCLGRSSSTQQHTKLREELDELGDQLLSDLNIVQQSYMEELPAVESTLDIDEMIMPKERKRRHSVIATAPSDDSGIWSFTSRLEEDCLIQMSTMPTLRSVTL